MLKTVTYDDAMHVVVPINPPKKFWELANKADDNSMEGSCCSAPNEKLYECVIAAAPPFTSLPNPDLEIVGQALQYAANNYGSVNMVKLACAIAALKRLKGDV